MLILFLSVNNFNIIIIIIPPYQMSIRVLDFLTGTVSYNYQFIIVRAYNSEPSTNKVKISFRSIMFHFIYDFADLF